MSEPENHTLDLLPEIREDIRKLDHDLRADIRALHDDLGPKSTASYRRSRAKWWTASMPRAGSSAGLPTSSGACPRSNRTARNSLHLGPRHG